MYFPSYKATKQRSHTINVFGGYNHTLNCVENETYNAKNLSSEHFPLLSSRKPRGRMYDADGKALLCKGNDKYWIVGNRLYKNGTNVAFVGNANRLVSMASRIYAFPSGQWYDTVSSENGKIGVRVSNYFNERNRAKWNLLDGEGKQIASVKNESYYNTNKPADKDYCFFTTGGENVLRQYSKVQGSWIDVTDSMVRIEFPDDEGGQFSQFKKGDYVRIEVSLLGDAWVYSKRMFPNKDDERVWNDFEVLANTDTSITIYGAIPLITATYNNLPMEVSRMLPNMAYVTECGNRLWGCSKDGHTIYASALGDGTNWYKFNGISTDSYAVTIGSDGEFKGAITLNGYPYFFKENSVVKIYISSSGGHQVQENFVQGVSDSDSLCEVNGVLFYKSANGICVFDGSFPSEIGDVFGDIRYTDAVAGGFDHKYYISMSDGTDYHLFVYDTKMNIWEHEDNIHATAFATDGKDLYFFANGSLFSVNGEGTKEEAVEWFAEFGNIGCISEGSKYMHNLSLRATLTKGSSISAFISYDGGDYEPIFNLVGRETKSISLPLRIRRCDHLSFKLCGKGDVKLHSLTKTYEEASQIPTAKGGRI